MNSVNVTVPYVRTIKSYVCRDSRLSSSLKHIKDLLWSHFVITTGVELNAFLNRKKEGVATSEKILEIGFGDGTSLTQMARENPCSDFIGIEIFQKGIVKLLRDIDRYTLDNIRIIQGDAVEILERMIPPHSLSAIHIFFADPWPKTRHHKRRLIQPEFVELLALKLKPQGTLHLATDNQDYAQHMMKVISNNPSFLNCAGPYQFAPRPSHRPLTKYERRGLKQGHGAKDLIFKNKGLSPIIVG